MNELIKQLADQAKNQMPKDKLEVADWIEQYNQKFAELIVRECCLALWTEECHTSGLAFDEVKRNATRIKEHFGIDPNEITEDMLTRSITWMKQQLADKKHFGVEE
jgi:hypothetical protein